MTPPAELTAEGIRNIIREELAPVEERLTERIGAVERGVEEVKVDLAALREDLTGLTDERFPPVNTPRERIGGAPARGGIAASPARPPGPRVIAHRLTDAVGEVPGGAIGGPEPGARQRAS